MPDTCEMWLDRTFNGAYEFEIGKWPGGSCDRMFWYPGASTIGGRDGVLLSISPAGGRSWLGVFASHEVSPPGPSGAVALPDRRTLAVLTSGAFIGSRLTIRFSGKSRRPAGWWEIQSSSRTSGSCCLSSTHTFLPMDPTGSRGTPSDLCGMTFRRYAWKATCCTSWALTLR